MKNWLQKQLINILVKKLFNTIDVEDIITTAKTEDSFGKVKISGVYVRGRKLDQSEIDALREGAETIDGSAIWKLIENEVKYNANLRMYFNGKTDDDILMGKCCLYVLDIINGVLKSIKKL